MQRRLALQLTVKGPLITRTSDPGGYGLDAVAYLTPDGRIGAPKSLVLGKLKDAIDFLTLLGWKVPPSFAERLAGTADTGGRWSPVRRGVYMAPLSVRSNPAPGPRITQISLDRARHAASDRMMHVIENPVPVGSTAALESSLEFWEPDDGSLRGFLSALRLTFRALTQIGGERTTGFGAVTGVIVGDSEPAPKRLATIGKPSLSDGAWIGIEPLEPFSITARNVVSNLFESSDVIPGGVIKGAIATLISERGGSNFPALSAALSSLRITHAFPSLDGGIRPRVAPLSLVATGNDFFDAATHANPTLIRGAAPAFEPDWKDGTRAAASSHFGWADTGRRLVERHAHDRNSRTAKDRMVFALEETLPGKVKWIARLGLSVDSGNPGVVLDELSRLLEHGLYHIGKTHALAGVTLSENGAVKYRHESQLVPHSGNWIVTLMSHAILPDPVHLGLGTGEKELLDEYRAAWSDLSGGSLELSHFFARQSLAGGAYLRGRFGRRSAAYHPYVLTNPGSVFVFKAAADEGALGAQRAILDGWITRGLGLPSWARQRYGNDWQSCPYLPENGYGEIAVNLDHGLYLPAAAVRNEGALQ